MILAIYGAHGLAQEVYIIAKKINTLENRWKDFVFIDDINSIDQVQNKRVYTFEQLLQVHSKDELEVVIAVGEPALREKLYDKVKAEKVNVATLIHPGVYIDETTTIKEGVIICEGTTITCNVTIGENSYIQPHAIIGHDIMIGKHVVIGPAVEIGGADTIGDRVYMGFHSGTKEKISIGNDTICAAGAVVFQSLPEAVIAVGNPARIARRNEERTVFK